MFPDGNSKPLLIGFWPWGKSAGVDSHGNCARESQALFERPDRETRGSAWTHWVDRNMLKGASQNF